MQRLSWCASLKFSQGSSDCKLRGRCTESEERLHWMEGRSLIYDSNEDRIWKIKFLDAEKFKEGIERSMRKLWAHCASCKASHCTVAHITESSTSKDSAQWMCWRHLQDVLHSARCIYLPPDAMRITTRDIPKEVWRGCIHMVFQSCSLRIQIGQSTDCGEHSAARIFERNASMMDSCLEVLPLCNRRDGSCARASCTYLLTESSVNCQTKRRQSQENVTPRYSTKTISLNYSIICT